MGHDGKKLILGRVGFFQIGVDLMQLLVGSFQGYLFLDELSLQVADFTVQKAHARIFLHESSGVNTADNQEPVFLSEHQRIERGKRFNGMTNGEIPLEHRLGRQRLHGQQLFKRRVQKAFTGCCNQPFVYGGIGAQQRSIR
ncbi:MAG: hypothetical protein BWY72_02435 [Bacteroidetes bacterium ADurb.Bin416]|nr:MAG: hypothetical protein BWY72_02435 [Bacteroidetes bacterium ADurb.Bin416]